MTRYATTAVQREADELDLELFRLASRMLAFAETLPKDKQRPVREAALKVGSARSLVRDQMHPERRKETA